MKRLKVTAAEVISEINQRDIIIGLEQVSKTAKNESAKVSALTTLAKISGLLDESAKVQVQNYTNLMDAITDDLGEISPSIRERSMNN